MSKLPEKYDAKTQEIHWQKYWDEQKIYQFRNDKNRDETFVIDTPPPTVSGLLHMGHIFSYTQADFVARFKRISGKDVFYPMGFDDNGLPTERLVEKIIGQKAMAYEAKEREKNQGGSGYFVEKCREIVKEAEMEFEDLFKNIALSVDWEQKYQTISAESQKISQASFVDLFKKGLVEKRFSPVFWDISDRTALAKADIIDKEIEGEMYFINFTLDGKNQKLEIMTTRPELLPACVAVMISTESKIFQETLKNLISQTLVQKLEIDGQGLTDLFAITPIFGVKVPIIVDNGSVKADKGTGAVMCCTYGDETDLEWRNKHDLPIREIIRTDGKLAKLSISENSSNNDFNEFQKTLDKEIGVIKREDNCFLYSSKEGFLNSQKFLENYQIVAEKNIKDAKKIIIEMLQEQNLLAKNSEKTLRPVKCAERSGVPIEIISTAQWFIKILPFKEQFKIQARKCNWYPDYMRVRIEQWIDGLSWDWCISRQRFFGVKFPIWNLKSFNPEDHNQAKSGSHFFSYELAEKTITADISQLPVDPEIDIPLGYILVDEDEIKIATKEFYSDKNYSKNDDDFKQKIVKDLDGKLWFLFPETDVLDTWATSSISPQLSSKGISDEVNEILAKNQNLVGEHEFTSDEATQSENQIQNKLNLTRHQKLFPADMRPQAHEIIRTWAFYTIVKAYLHSLKIVKDKNGNVEKNLDGSVKLQENPNSNQTIPWKNLMISGWCLASDKTKMSKSKGNVVTPTALIQEKSADVVRYWASASNLGADIAYSEDVFKIGQKLITKLFNSAKFCSQHFEVLQDYFEKNNQQNLSDENLSKLITHTSDLWILARLEIVIDEYNKQFQIYEYAKAREVLEEFFWHYLCDNYLEICKVRSYGLQAQKLENIDLTAEQKQEVLFEQLSSLATLSIILKNILKLFAPFIPFICEEIYSKIFSEEFKNLKSIHARGNKAILPNELKKNNAEILKIGDEILKILFEVRKYKSEKNQSMKTEIELLEISSELDLSGVKTDIANVCNAKQIIVSKGSILIKIL